MTMARNVPLTVVVLSGLNHLTDKSVYALGNSCPYLEEVYLSGCSLVTRNAVHWLTVSYFHGDYLVAMALVWLFRSSVCLAYSSNITCPMRMGLILD